MATAEKSEYEPLDTLQIKVCSMNGISNTVSAIHKGFMEIRSYVTFKAPMFPDTGQKNLTPEEEEWLESTTFLEEDLHWVLRLPYHRFWSQVVYDEELHKCLESYLSQAPRHYDLNNFCMKKELSDLLKRIHRLVFLIYLRMSTYKESREHHLRPTAFGTLVYDNYLFDVAKLMDLCALYGMQNSALVSKMITNIFSCQPKYAEDLSCAVHVILEAFNVTEERLTTSVHEMDRIFSAGQVNGEKSSRNSPLSTFHDIINHITDISATLHAFLSCYPPSCQIFYQNGAMMRLSVFYEQTFPLIQKEVTRRSKSIECKKIMEDIKRKVTLSKTLIIKTFRCILDFCCIQNVISSQFAGESAQSLQNIYIEQFLEIFSEVANVKNFLRDYNVIYPFETDLEVFSECGLKLDHQKLHSIFSSIHGTRETPLETYASTSAHGARPKDRKQTPTHKPTKNLQEIANMLKEPNVDDLKEDVSRNSSKNSLPEAEMNSLVEYICEIMGDIEKELVKRCLHRYNYDAEKVIDALVTGNVPDDIMSTDNDMSSCSNETVEYDSNSLPSILDERKCVFDNDEFDIFRRDDVNMENIHIGKKNKTLATYTSLRDEPDAEFLKHLTLAYAEDETQCADDVINLYEDEYDDTYDSAMVGLKEPAAEGEPEVDAAADNKKFEGTFQSSENSEEPSRDRSKDFCEDPSVVRERRQQRWESKMAARGRKVGPPPSADTSNSRHHKDRHKAQVSNHNRRQQSDFKRSRGMVPI